MELLMNTQKECQQLEVYGEYLKKIPELLKQLETSEGAPVFLTKNGRGEYVILDMKDYDRMKAELALMAELGKGEKTVREEDWVSTEEVEESYE